MSCRLGEAKRETAGVNETTRANISKFSLPRYDDDSLTRIPTPLHVQWKYLGLHRLFVLLSTKCLLDRKFQVQAMTYRTP
eukprot:scaffold846_cov336-Pavlova_lutheri.AAC.11